MGSINSKEESQQVLIVGPQRSGKTLLFKRFLNKKKELDKTDIESTLGFNHSSTKYENIQFDLWDLGGDPLSKSYWPTFYRNLRFTLVIFLINIVDESSFPLALKELLILLNEEELKQAKFFILFNLAMDDDAKIKLGEKMKTEYKDKMEELINYMKESNVHEFESRVNWDLVDIAKMSDGDCMFLSRFFMGITSGK